MLSNKSVFSFLSLLFFLGAGFSQTMTWVPSDYSTDGVCENLTDCRRNIVCYKLRYIPNESGVLTSYTTGFLADCQNRRTIVVRNESCVMNDNSMEVVGCENFDKILLHASGNTGNPENATVEAGVAVYLHQVCFELTSGDQVVIQEDEVTDLTTSLDLPSGRGLTEFPAYIPFALRNDRICTPDRGKLKLIASHHDQRESFLQWPPSMETGAGQYTIERSFDGERFEPIATMEEHQFNPRSLRYELIDPKAQFGYNFYRVSYRNGQGETVTSNTASIHFHTDEFKVNVSPNPATDFIQVRVASTAAEINFTIMDELGKVIHQVSNPRQLVHELDLKNLPAGVYFLTTATKQHTATKRFVLITQ